MKCVEKILAGTACRKRLLEGVALICKTVGITLGPRGRNVAIAREHHMPLVTKDGVTVAKHVGHHDRSVQIGIELVREAAKETEYYCDDGTTTATVVLGELIAKVNSLVESGYHPIEVIRELQVMHAAVVAELRDMTLRISGKDELRKVARIASNGDDSIANVIVDAIYAAGADGVVTIRDKARGMADEIVTSEGFEMQRGMMHGCNPQLNEIVMEDVSVLVCDQPLLNVSDIFPVLESCSRKRRALVIVVESLTDEIKQVLLANNFRNTLKSAVVLAPAYDERPNDDMSDIAVFSGATHIHHTLGWIENRQIDFGALGHVDRVIINRGSTTFIGGKGDPTVIETRINELRATIKNTEVYQEQIAAERRLARICSMHVEVYCYGDTQPEIKERYERMADCLGATKSAMEHGVVQGGGMALARAAERVHSKYGSVYSKLFAAALAKPSRLILDNAGFDNSISMVARAIEAGEWVGYDAITGEPRDFWVRGIYDSAYSVIRGLDMAMSVLTTVCMSDVLVLKEVPLIERIAPGLPSNF